MQSNLAETVSALSGRIEALLPGTAGYSLLLNTVATGLIGDVKSRIHVLGLAADGSPIGKYSTTPLYVSTRTKGGVNPGAAIGKTGKSKFGGGKRKGQSHTSRYFAGGYGEFKSAVGKSGSGNVNLTLTGELCNQLSVQSTGAGFGLGWGDAEKLDRARTIEKKYGKKIWSLTQPEKLKSISIAQKFITNALS